MDASSPVANNEMPITSVLLRGDGQVLCCVAGEYVSPPNQPRDVKLVVLSKAEAYCRTSQGKLYRCKDASKGWQLDNSKLLKDIDTKVSSLMVLDSGELGIVANSQVFVQKEDGQFEICNDLTKWMKPCQRGFRVTKRFRRVVVLLLICGAALFAGARKLSQWQAMREVIEESRSHTFVDQMTEEIPEASMMTRAFGFDPFRSLAHLRFSSSLSQSDEYLPGVGLHTSLKELELTLTHDLEELGPADLTPLSKLEKLKKFHLEGYVKSLRPLSVLRELQVLQMANAEVDDPSYFPSLPQLKELALPKEFGIAVAKNSPLLEVLRCNVGPGFPSVVEHLPRLRSLWLTGEIGEADLRKLTELPDLEQLQLHLDGELNSLHWLAKFPKLKSLCLVSENAPLNEAQLAPLANLQHLSHLELPEGSRFDVSLLEVLPQLEMTAVFIGRRVSYSHREPYQVIATDHVCLNLTNTVSIEPYRDYMGTINELDVSGTQVTDISLIADYSNIQYLRIADCEIQDFAPIAELPNLIELDVSGTSFSESDLSLIQNSRTLQTLKLARTKFADLQSLVRFPNLSDLDVSETQVVELDRIFKLRKLESLSLSGCRIGDIHELRWLTKLEELKIDRTQVADITPLLQLPITDLDLFGIPAADRETIDSLADRYGATIAIRLPDGEWIRREPERW